MIACIRKFPRINKLPAVIKNKKKRGNCRRIFAAVISALFAVILSAGIFAEENTEGNVLGNYRNADWQGDKLFFDEYSGSLYFEGNTDKEKQSAVISADLSEGSTGFFFYVDGGNGKGSDGGFITLEILDGGGEVLFSSSTGNVEGFANFSRFSIGDEGHYYPVPKRAETARITFTANQKDNGERVNIYFRNFTLLFSEIKPLLLPDDKDLMDCKAGLSKVEVGVTSADRWFWIITIFAVALIFLIIAKWKQKYSTPKVMKGTDRKVKNKGM